MGRINNMVPEIAAILLGTCVGAVAVVYAGSKGYLGHRKTRAAPSPATTASTFTASTSQAEAPAAAEPVTSPAPSPAPSQARYETVQPAPAPVTYSAPSSTSFAAPSIAKKPTRTYRRRTAPVRGATGVKKTLAKPKKR
ncbi:MAG: hypothetical protein JRM79_00315 [Nitrososphaerota archaeon]|nr:hypothetical protein [Nitrososphaerota archaeon]MDG6903736.1 hypothetical protein [Nitrososphaerota archaeon]MDG6912169.1 hypothetical protein [Nitrososphaerota archaeon]MDG6941146.1 hypothetical protein [Nitrososphaerota archaeon]MDG6943214.1 hypothetical protein [Nitrososphaerota archaeon]